MIFRCYNGDTRNAYRRENTVRPLRSSGRMIGELVLINAQSLAKQGETRCVLGLAGWLDIMRGQ